MLFIKNTLIFMILTALHVELLWLFSSSFYLLYFVNILLILYFLHRYFDNYPLIYLALYIPLILVMINSDIYDEYLFEFLLNFNLFKRYIYVNSEVMYVLSIVHLLVFINLKRLGDILGYNRVKSYLG